MSMDIDIEIKGPVSDGMGPLVMGRFKEDLLNALSDKAVNDIRAYLPTQYMYLGHNGGTPMFNPVPPDAGALEAAVHTERATENVRVVTDDPVLYGPWIEGDAPGNAIVWLHRRNPPPRRFPGYHAFRKIAQKLDADVARIADDMIVTYIEELNA